MNKWWTMVTWGWLTTLPRVDRLTCTHRIKDGVVDRLTTLPRVDRQIVTQRWTKTGEKWLTTLPRVRHANSHKYTRCRPIYLHKLGPATRVLRIRRSDGRPVEGCWARQTFRWFPQNKSRDDGRKGTGIRFPGRCTRMLPPPRETETKGKNRGWKSSTVFHTWPVACWPHEKRNYFTGCRPVETINSYSTRKYKLQFVAGWPTNKLTHKHKAKRKITMKRGVRACASLDRVEREVPFRFR